MSWRGHTITRCVLGTAQIGMPYGIANDSNDIGETQAKSILKKAMELGIQTIDTAQAYGESERFISYALDNLSVQEKINIITKIDPKLSLNNKKKIFDNIHQSIEKLGKLFGLMIHNEEWLNNIDSATSLIEKVKNDELCQFFGASVYTPELAKVALNHPLVDFIQIPVNYWDRRMIHENILELAKKKNKLCFIRSVFLQGLLTLTPEEVRRKLPIAYDASLKWYNIIKESRMTATSLALEFALSLDCPLVIGVNDSYQLMELSRMIRSYKHGRLYSDLGFLVDSNILNPSTWR